MDYREVLGIDLGTTYSCIGVWKNGKVEVIPNQETGNRITPSVVSFTNKDIIVGEAAKNQVIRNYKNTVYDSKRLIGRDYNDPEVQDDIKLWPFKVIKGDNNKPKIEVEYKGNTESFYPEEILSYILSKLKQNAKYYLGHEVNEAIISCPTYFNELQRKAIKLASKIAGLNVLRIINSSNAAAITYGLDIYNQGEKNILIFDLGGGKFDVTILSIDNNLIEVRSICGDSHLGGEDFDNRLLQYCIKKFKDESGIDISNNKKAKIRLKVECEKAKINLSTMQKITIETISLADGKDFNITITRPHFEDLCKKDFDKCIPIVKKALKDANLTKEKINDVVLVGGSTRIPKIQQIVKDYFGKEPNKRLHPDEAVAIGAAIQGALTNNIEDEGLKRLVLLEVTKEEQERREKELIKKYKESKNYVKNLDKKSINKINTLTNIEITEKNLIEAQLSNKENYTKINDKIDTSCNTIMKNPLTTKKYLKEITTLGTNLKNKIIYEAYNKPDKFIPLKETEKADMTETIFIEGILAKTLINNQIIVSIEKETSNEDLSLTMLQLLSSGEAFKKKINITYDYGEEKNAKIITNIKEKESFILSKRKEISLALNIPIENIVIENIRFGSIGADIIIKDHQINDEELAKIAQDKAVTNIEFKALLEGCLISPYMFDPEGDRSSGWGEGESRGPPHHLQKYYPPIGWNGYGLRVSNQYDDGDDTWLGYDNVEGEWYIAYHGTGGLKVVKNILEKGFQSGIGQDYKNSNNMNPLTNKTIPKCGIGVYSTPVIEEAKNYSYGIDFGGNSYYLVFMCRINPYKVRFADKEHPAYWIVSGNPVGSQNSRKYSDEIRPYRILLKKK